MNLVDPLAGQISECGEVLLSRQPSRLEATHLALPPTNRRRCALNYCAIRPMRGVLFAGIKLHLIAHRLQGNFKARTGMDSHLGRKWLKGTLPAATARVLPASAA